MNFRALAEHEKAHAYPEAPMEFAAPYYALRDAGAELTLVSPAGGQPPLDPKSDAPDAQTDARQ